MIDVSTLGKIEISGPEAIKFLHFLLPGKYAKFEVGRTRYSIMIGEDGILFEDGTISHIEHGITTLPLLQVPRTRSIHFFNGGCSWKILMCRSRISA